ncbi:TetR/AcrR family transcriptional regulator [Microbacterium sp. BR1]|uniref:TetR/AcrR family transcriptional regulator n=1 Tax=Microbacterium sp. BR1 TaxID=1070896 RepID=UPI0012FDFC17|nr:TetR/AcrR family transcriptional regulator [Microbacterium sp. BR1]
MTPPREHRPIEERRQQLVDASVDVMTESGIAAVTTRAITARAGLPHGAFHYCFASKAELFAAILTQEVRRSLSAAFEPPVEPEAPVDRIALGLRARLDLVMARPTYALALTELMSLSHRDPELGHLATWEQREYLREVTRNIAEWSEADGLRWTVTHTALAALLIAISDGVASAWLSSRDDAAADETIRVAATAISTLLEEGRS